MSPVVDDPQEQLRHYLGILAGFGQIKQAAAVLAHGAARPILARADWPRWLEGAVARYCAPQHCFWNSRRLAGLYSRRGLTYAEGYAMAARGWAVHHGWLALEEHYVEVTWGTPGLAYLGVIVPAGAERLSARPRRCVGTSMLDDPCCGWPYLRTLLAMTSAATR